MSTFPPPRANSAPAFAGARPGPGQKYAVEWVKKRLRAIHREARDAGRDSPLNEAAAHLYLLIATYVLDKQFISEPMRLQELASIMHCESITVTRARKRLRDEVQLVDGGQGKAGVRFALVKMAGPLYAEQGGAVAGSDGATSIPESEVLREVLRSQSRKLPATSISESEVLRSQRSKYAATSIPQSEVATGHLMYPEEVGTSSTSHNAAEGAEAMMPAERRGAAALARDLHTVDLFCDWWPDAYRAHNRGVLNRVRPCDREAAETLIVGTGRTLERVQAMSIYCWTVKSDGHYQSDRWYIARTDRSICTVLTKETFLENEVVRLGLDAPRDQHASESEQSTPFSAHRERVLARLRQSIAAEATSLGELLAGIAEQISTLDVTDCERAAAQLEILDAEMLQAAHRAVDVDQLQAAADAELATCRSGMTNEAYQRARDAAIDRLVREQLRLPVLVWTEVAGVRVHVAPAEAAG